MTRAVVRKYPRNCFENLLRSDGPSLYFDTSALGVDRGVHWSFLRQPFRRSSRFAYGWRVSRHLPGADARHITSRGRRSHLSQQYIQLLRKKA